MQDQSTTRTPEPERRATGYFDGLVEPRNPGGHACCGWAVIVPDSQTSTGIHCIASTGGYYVGYGTTWHDPASASLLEPGSVTTNNICEYLAAIECLRKIYRLPWRGPVLLKGDSRLVCEQYAGTWKCNSPNLQRLLRHLHTAASHFESVKLQWVPREQNQQADGEARRVYREVAGHEAPDRSKQARAKRCW